MQSTPLPPEADSSCSRRDRRNAKILIPWLHKTIFLYSKDGEGAADGAELVVGSSETVGISDGSSDGWKDGETVGMKEGIALGSREGCSLGPLVGEKVGYCVGNGLGDV